MASIALFIYITPFYSIFMSASFLPMKIDLQEHFAIKGEIQPPITPRNRAVLIDWLMEVHSCFGWHTQTLHLMVSIVNR